MGVGWDGGGSEEEGGSSSPAIGESRRRADEERRRINAVRNPRRRFRMRGACRQAHTHAQYGWSIRAYNVGRGNWYRKQNAAFYGLF
jgi:hypothetical protein